MSSGSRRANAALIGLAIGGLALILFGAVSLGLYERQHAQEGESAAHYSAHDTRGEVSATCTQEARTRTYRCTADIPQADRHDPYAEHDLRAQQDMARWAYVVALVGFGSLLLTGAGVWLLWFTLEATNATLKEAEQTTQQAALAAVAANEQTQIAQRAFIAANPPKISLQQVSYHPERDDAGFLWIRNIGHTDAIIVDLRFAIFQDVPPSQGIEGVHRADREYRLAEASEEQPLLFPAGHHKRWDFKRLPVPSATQLVGASNIYLFAKCVFFAVGNDKVKLQSWPCLRYDRGKHRWVPAPEEAASYE